jgi:hypothetical protein
MARYIDAEAFKNKLDAMMTSLPDQRFAMKYLAEISKWIDEQPTAYNVEQVLDDLDEMRTEAYDEENDEAVKALDGAMTAVKAGGCI